MSITSVFVGGNKSAKRILDKSSIDPELVISFTEQNRNRVSGYPTYEEYEDKWFQVNSINSERTKSKLQSVNPDVIFVMSWPELLDEEVLNIPTEGCVGRHLALLPKRRGRASVAWALIHNLDKTGVTLFWLDSGVDTGDIIAQHEIPIAYEDDAGDLFEKAATSTISLIDGLLPQFESGTYPRREQDESKASYTHPRRPDMGLIDWTKSATELYHFIRAQTRPYPGAFTYHKMDKVTVWQSEIVDESAVEAVPGTLLEAVGEDHYNVQTGEGILKVEIENQHGRHPIKSNSVFGCEEVRYTNNE
jgi:methionyl-tRNA formyltransferase